MRDLARYEEGPPAQEDEARFIARMDDLIAGLPLMTDPGEMKALRDKAAALRPYIQQQRWGRLAQNKAAEAKVRAERQIGEWLAGNVKHGGDRKSTFAQPRLNGALPEGISWWQSSKWQQLARMPEAEFDRCIREIMASVAGELATLILLRRARELERSRQRAETGELAEATEAPEGTYRTLVVDPPWEGADSGDDDPIGRGDPLYSTMTVAELACLPVGDLAEPEDCHLYLWTTNRMLPHAFDLLDAWEFRYLTLLTWCKPSIGVGRYYRNNTEHVLFALRGTRLLARADVGTWFEAPREGRHSTKPAAFYRMVEECSPGPRLEMFARSPRDGWAVWGAEVGPDGAV